MHCLKCGADNPADAEICAHCGASLKPAAPANPTTEPTTNSGAMPTNLNSAATPAEPTAFTPYSPDLHADVTQNQPAKPTSSKKPLLITLIAVAVVAVIGVAAFFLISALTRKNLDNELSLEAELTSSNAFFLLNEDGQYALFNLEGKRLTDFIFTNTYSFVNGAALVEINDDEEGIIGTDGKMIVDYGTCRYLWREGAFYECTDANHDTILLDAKGKEIARDRDLEIHSNVGDYQYVVTELDDEYALYDYKGNLLTTFEAVSGFDEPYVRGHDRYVTAYYNNQNYIFDVTKSKQILQFADETIYCLEDADPNNSEIFTIKSCSLSFFSNEKSDYVHKLIKNGEVKYTKTSAERSTLTFEGSNVIYNADNEYWLLDDNGNEALNVRHASYQDTKNYAKLTEDERSVEIYQDGNLRETYTCGTLHRSYAAHGVYLLGGCKGYGDQSSVYVGNNWMYITADGKWLNETTYDHAQEFDENGYAVVSNDGDWYYLINTKGEKVSADYYKDRSAERIYAVDGTSDVYTASNEDGTTSLFVAGGDVLMTGGRITTEAGANGVFSIISQEDKYIVYDVKQRKELVTLDKRPDLYDEYFSLSNDGHTYYYSYKTGAMFHQR